MPKRAIIVGAGAGGLSAAVDLAAAGWEVDVFETNAEPGGKMHQRRVGEVGIDGGPTVFTMHWVFDELFKRAGAVFDNRVRLTESRRLARHAWTDGSHLDLFHDIDQSAQAIADFSDERNAQGYRRFCDDGELVHNLLRDNFMATSQPSPIRLGYRLLRDGGLRSLAVAPHRSLWNALGNYFSDPRLRQLYGRYATYVGSSPLSTPSTLMLIAHVERQGVWCVDGGMRALAHAMADLATEHGARFHFESPVRKINCTNGRATGITLSSGKSVSADAIIFNGDAAALSNGLLGDDVLKSTQSANDRRVDCLPSPGASTPPPRVLNLIITTCSSLPITSANSPPFLNHDRSAMSRPFMYALRIALTICTSQTGRNDCYY
jgi:1-hydroxycarotenoid 3,4-desaturase